MTSKRSRKTTREEIHARVGLKEGIPKRTDYKKGTARTAEEKAARDAVPRVPQNPIQMRKFFSGDERFRGPETRAEKRAWDRYWSYRGRGFNKPPRKYGKANRV